MTEENIIHRLSELTSNQIAAGEVVLRPASVVKELLENAIDAGASMVVLGIRDAGTSSIQVIDDGCGMSYDDAITAFERHATSKIKDSNDLFSLSTFGFRGEALPSIASVAEVELKTKREVDELGTLVTIAGGKLDKHSHISTSVGTQFTVKNLFYNVPARRRFIKSLETETRHIITEFKKLALCHNGVTFVMHNNDKCIYNLPATNLRNRITDIIGDRSGVIKGNSKLIDIHTPTPLVEIKGYVGRPEKALRSPEQYMFVNGRYFRSERFNRAVLSAYDNLLVSNNVKPPFFIFLTCDPSEVDVNVSPSKTEVKFENEETIAQLIRASVLGALGKNGIIPMIDFDGSTGIEIPVSSSNGHFLRNEQESVIYDANNSDFSFTEALYGDESDETTPTESYERVESDNRVITETFSLDDLGSEREERVVIPSAEDMFMNSDTNIYTQTIQSDNDVIATFEDYINDMSDEEPFEDDIVTTTIIEESEPTIIKEEEINLFGDMSKEPAIGDATIIDGRYILTTIDNDIYIVDLSRAMSRIMYDRYSQMIEHNNSVNSHKLLFPPTIKLQPSDMLLIEDSVDDLIAMGFTIELNESLRELELIGIPVDMEDSDPYQLFEDILDSLKTDDNLGYNADKRERLISTVSKIASLRRGDKSSTQNYKQIVEQLLQCENYSYSPQGNSIIVKIGLNDIKRLLG